VLASGPAQRVSTTKSGAPASAFWVGRRLQPVVTVEVTFTSAGSTVRWGPGHGGVGDALGAPLAVTGGGGALVTGSAAGVSGGVALALALAAGATGEVRGSATLPGSATQPLIMGATTTQNA
jgi:hypothetical protein